MTSLPYTHFGFKAYSLQGLKKNAAKNNIMSAIVSIWLISRPKNLNWLNIDFTLL